MPETAKPVVWISHRDDERCTACGITIGKGNVIQINAQEGLRCAMCAGFGDLVYLPSGDPALTRRAVAHSSHSAVVVQFSRARKRNERRGSLVEPAALVQGYLAQISSGPPRSSSSSNVRVEYHALVPLVSRRNRRR
jgi:hypothetical protein